MSDDIDAKLPLFHKPVLTPAKQARSAALLQTSNDYSAGQFHASTNITKSSALTGQAWAEELDHAKHQPWNATVAGRGSIRLFSRGLVGASFFALATRYVDRSFASYHPEGDMTKPLHYVVKGVDKLVGKPLEAIANAMGHDGKAFVTFRPTKYFYGAKNGVSLGHEVVALTFDFSSMSMGDALGRDISGALDPNVHHNWIDKGHINYQQAAKNVAKSAFRYLTYNSGEDWAVAVPYAFFVRGQRNLIDKISPGFGYDQDRRLNGGSFKVNDHGKITGTYGLEGLLDLQSRFTVYNMGTLMFREGYTNISKGLHHWYDSGAKLPTGPESLNGMGHKAVDLSGSFVRWALRDMVKATMYMTPAVPAFWMFRTPQTKYRGSFIHAEKGIISFGEKALSVQANEVSRTLNRLRPESERFSIETPTYFSAANPNGGYINKGEVTNPFVSYGRPTGDKGYFKINAYENTYGAADSVLNPFGSINNQARKTLHYPVRKGSKALNVNVDGRTRLKGHADSYINAAFAYTPYFFMKNDVLAYRLDTAKMDLAIERAIDGVTHFKPSEFKEGVGEVWAAMRDKPFHDPARELEAQKAICDDESPSDGQNFYANARCFDSALQDLDLHKEYHQDAETHNFVERLKDSKKRSRNLINNFRQEAVSSFADTVQPKKTEILEADNVGSFVDRERSRKIQSLSDFPDVNTTLH